MNEWIARRWFGGRAAVEAWRHRRKVQAHLRRPLVTAHVCEQVAVPRTAAEIWAFVTDPGNEGAILGAQHVRSFVVPGTPAGAVGEVLCTVVRQGDGSWKGVLGETVERVEGVRLVVRVLSEGHGHRETVTVADGELTWEVAAETHPEHVEALRPRLSAALVEHLGRIAACMTGQVAPEVDAPCVPRCADGGSIVDIEVTAAIEIASSAEDAWELVADAERVALESSDPSAVSFTVPGSRRGEVGELVCVLVDRVGGGRAATFQQVVGLRPGRSIVLRSLSGVPEHAWEREVVVEPLPIGARLTHRVLIPVHRHERVSARVLYGQGATRYLRVVEEELVRA